MLKPIVIYVKSLCFLYVFLLNLKNLKSLWDLSYTCFSLLLQLVCHSLFSRQLKSNIFRFSEFMQKWKWRFSKVYCWSILIPLHLLLSVKWMIRLSEILEERYFLWRQPWFFVRLIRCKMLCRIKWCNYWSKSIRSLKALTDWFSFHSSFFSLDFICTQESGLFSCRSNVIFVGRFLVSKLKSNVIVIISRRMRALFTRIFIPSTCNAHYNSNKSKIALVYST